MRITLTFPTTINSNRILSWLIRTLEMCPWDPEVEIVDENNEEVSVH